MFTTPRATLLFALVGTWGVAGQTYTVVAPTCTLPTFNWTSNSLGQDVCTMAGFALIPCATGTINIPKLTSPDDQYIGPAGLDDGNLCKCNTILYSLISACGACQGDSWQSYGDYSFNCTTRVPEGSWPTSIVGFPADTAIPAWAFQPVSTLKDKIWLNTTSFAFYQTNRTEFTATSQPSPSSAAAGSANTLTPGSGSATAATPGSSQTAVGASKSGGSSHTGAIAGGVVGGVVGVALLIAGGWLLYSRRRSGLPSTAPATEQIQPVAPVFAGDQSLSAAGGERKYYDPADPSTFPGMPYGAGVSIPASPTSGEAAGLYRTSGHVTSWASNPPADYRGLPEV